MENFKKWINGGISRRLLFTSIAFWIVSLACLAVVIFSTGQSEIANDISQRNVHLASMVSRDINSQINSFNSDLRTFCSRLQASSVDLKTQAGELIGLRLASPKRYISIEYLDIDDNLLFNINDPVDDLINISDANVVVDRVNQPVDPEVGRICDLTRGMATYISEVHFTRLENAPALYIGKLLNFPTGERRLAVFEISLDDIWQRIDLSTVGKTGYTCVVSQQGLFIAHPDKQLIGSEIPAEIEPVLMGYEGFTEYPDKSVNKTILAAYSPVGGPLGWGIIVAQDKSEANTPLARAGGIIGGVWLALSALGTVGIVVMAKNFTKPISTLTQTVKLCTTCMK